MQIDLSGSVSSQYLTALLMAAPLATGDGGVEIRITDELVSQPYVDMTVRLMERFGVKVRRAARVASLACNAIETARTKHSSGMVSCFCSTRSVMRHKSSGEVAGAVETWLKLVPCSQYWSPYIVRLVTCPRMLDSIGAHDAMQVERLDGLQHIRIPVGQQYRSPGSAYVEGDASSASYFLAGATMTGVTLPTTTGLFSPCTHRGRGVLKSMHCRILSSACV